ncbi:hypothetical protein D3M59_10660 [Sphingomonas edaphi]|uniref:Uncharacterized protein n=1 Tax=Sphingomonas edaphi TaxID=2315689 RepID=A0A418PYD9_9SPHN|nr:hypothetical protein D3M59_10660 [Sphingomonas edaphi]
MPRRRALEALRSLAGAIGGDVMPVCFVGEKEVVGYRHPSAGLTMLATACYRPMLCEQAQELRSSNGDHVLIVRLEDETHGYGPFTIDLLIADTRTWLIRYRLWQIHPTGDLWLVPSEGEGRSIRIVGGYLALSPRAPFYNLFEREHGFNVAAKTFAALQGAK